MGVCVDNMYVAMPVTKVQQEGFVMVDDIKYFQH